MLSYLPCLTSEFTDFFLVENNREVQWTGLEPKMKR